MAMSAASLIGRFQGLTLGTVRMQKVKPQPFSCSQIKSLSSTRNGICSAQRIQLQPRPQAVTVAEEGLTVVCKLKTRKAASKRYKVTGSGKIVARKPGKQHLNEKKSKDRKRRLSRGFMVNDRDMPAIKENMPYHRIK